MAGASERVLDLGDGIIVTITPLRLEEVPELLAACIARAQAEGASGPTMWPLTIFYLDRVVALRGLLAWEGVDDGEGNVPPITEENWAAFARLRPDLAMRIVREICGVDQLGDLGSSMERPSPLSSLRRGAGAPPSPGGGAPGSPSRGRVH